MTLSLVAGLCLAAPSSVKTVSYSTGVGGSRLKWLPLRPAEPDRAVQTAAAEPLGAPGAAKPVERAAGNAPLDPFGDGKVQSPSSPSQQPAKPESSSAEKSVVLPPSEAVPKPALGPPAAPDAKPKAGPPAQPEIKEEMQVAVVPTKEECPDPQEVLVPVRKKSILENVTPKPGDFPHWCPMGKESFVPRSWAPTTFHWTASALCHKPVYFEDLQLERYGHTFGPWLQPVISGGHFFLSVPALPYAMGLFPPNECIYTLGYYRPGSCTPYMFDALPMSIRAILVEGGVWTGMAFLIP